MKKTFIILAFLIAILSIAPSFGASGNSLQREVGQSSDTSVKNPMMPNRTPDFIIEKFLEDRLIHVTGSLSVTGKGLYVLQEPDNELPTIPFYLRGNLKNIEKFMGKQITAFGMSPGFNLLDGVPSFSSLDVYYYFEKPTADNKMAEFAEGTLKSVAGEVAYYYVDDSKGNKTFLVGDLSKAQKFLNSKVRVSGKNRQGNPPKVLRDSKIFETVSFTPIDEAKGTRIEIRGVLSKKNNQFLLSEVELLNGPKGYVVFKDYLLSNNTSYMDKHVGKKIAATGISSGKNSNELRVFFYHESPDIMNLMAQYSVGVLKTVEGEELYYYIESKDGAKTFIKGGIDNASKLLGKTVTASGTAFKGGAPRVFKSEEVWAASYLEEGDALASFSEAPRPNPQPNPQPKPQPDPSPNNPFSLFFQWFSQIFRIIARFMVSIFQR
jgi:hypothetical protein